MDTKLFARLGAIIFVAIAITMTAIEMSRPADNGMDAPAPMVPVSQAIDPLLIELRHCQSLGAAGASDQVCLRTWAENRRRFLTPGARPAARIADDASAKEN